MLDNVHAVFRCDIPYTSVGLDIKSLTISVPKCFIIVLLYPCLQESNISLVVK